MANNQQQIQSSSDDKKYPYFYFTSVNRRVNPYTVKDHELYDSVNFWTEYQIGSKRARPGYTLFMDRIDNNQVTGLFYMRFPNGQKRLARVSGNAIYAADPNVAVTWGSKIITLTNPLVRPDFTALQAIGHIVTQISPTESHYIEWKNTNPTDTMVDTAYASGGADVVIPYKALTCQTYHRRVYVGSPYDASGLYGSQIGWSCIDYTPIAGEAVTPWSTFSNDIASANLTPIDADYKGTILKLTETNDYLNVYKQGGVYSFNETSVFSAFGLAPYQGSIANEDENKTDYFFTNEGFFSNNGTKVTPIGEGWYPIIKQILQNGIDTTKICSAAINFLYFCFMGNVTYDGRTINNAMFVYNAYYDEMYLWSMGHQITAMGYYPDTSGNKQLIFGDVNGFTYKLDYTATTDSGISIQAYLKSKYYWFDEPDKQNQIDQIYGFADPFGGEMEVSVDKDFVGEYKYPFLNLLGQMTKKRKDPSDVGAFKVLSFKVSWNGKGNRPGFYGIIMTIKQDSDRTQGRKQQ